MKRYLLAITIALASAPAAAQNINPAPAEAPPTYQSVLAMKVPVVAGDITDRPYRVVGEIETGVKKLTLFSKDPSQEKVYKELWERGKKMGADAVVNATYGDPRVTFMSWGSRKARGQAIKFLTDEEIAARTVTPPAPIVTPVDPPQPVNVDAPQ
ncbi:hypothetical protein [Sphingopyxis sp. 113P3]|uniref:hypothetical protein n=1 Tax=Sphingopyxis sp. (strain 113P3) TaxID=292913 RepID=UPI0006AD48F8|nr:hypothetical protein [Sphingopyxis sp. 113P3]ALC12512.1 hypothetical protein LH20_11170 [Sphingopyxis sp. 113P3]